MLVRRDKIKKFRAISFGILFLTAFLSVVIFALDYRFSASYVKKQKAEFLNELAPYSDTSAKLFIVNSKLTDISQILNKRANYSEKINKIVQDGSESIVIDEFSITKDGVQMTIKSNSLTAVDNYLNYLIDLVNDEELSSVTLNKLSADDVEYSVDIRII